METAPEPVVPLDDRLEAPRRAGTVETLRRRFTALREAVTLRLRDPARVLAVVLVVGFVLRIAWINGPPKALIFDETYYVNAARVILGLQASTHYADSTVGFDPNTEHPPLGKLLIAGSISVFGDNGLGWRFPSLVAGIIALLAAFAIARSLDRSAWLAVLATALLSLDNLTFVHGRIGTLDILVLAPMLVGAWLALRQRWILAAIAMAIALLIKLTAVFGIAAILLYVLLTEGPAWWRARRIPLRQLVGPAVFVFVTLAEAVGGLALLDARYTKFASPLDHLNRMVSYGANLRAPATAGICPKADSRPWQWLVNECQITYYRVDVTVKRGQEVASIRPKVDFRGAMNPVLVGAIPLATIFGAWYTWRKRNRLALWALVWFGANYVPYLILAIATPRIEYIYYALPLIPALAMLTALLVLRGGLPRPVQWGVVVAYVVGFAAYFPFRQIP